MKYVNTDYDVVIDKTDESFPDYTVLHTFQCVENAKHYVIFTDGSTNEAGLQNIYAAAFDPDCDESELIDLETAEEIEMVHEVLADLSNDGKRGISAYLARK